MSLAQGVVRVPIRFPSRLLTRDLVLGSGNFTGQSADGQHRIIDRVKQANGFSPSPCSKGVVKGRKKSIIVFIFGHERSPRLSDDGPRIDQPDNCVLDSCHLPWRTPPAYEMHRWARLIVVSFHHFLPGRWCQCHNPYPIPSRVSRVVYSSWLGSGPHSVFHAY